MELTPEQEYWKTHIDALESFEGSAVDYARLHDLDAKKLYERPQRTAGHVRTSTDRSLCTINQVLTHAHPSKRQAALRRLRPTGHEVFLLSYPHS